MIVTTIYGSGFKRLSDTLFFYIGLMYKLWCIANDFKFDKRKISSVRKQSHVFHLGRSHFSLHVSKVLFVIPEKLFHSISFLCGYLHVYIISKIKTGKALYLSFSSSKNQLFIIDSSFFFVWTDLTLAGWLLYDCQRYGWVWYWRKCGRWNASKPEEFLCNSVR